MTKKRRLTSIKEASEYDASDQQEVKKEGEEETQDGDEGPIACDEGDLEQDENHHGGGEEQRHGPEVDQLLRSKHKIQGVVDHHRVPQAGHEPAQDCLDIVVEPILHGPVKLGRAQQQTILQVLLKNAQKQRGQRREEEVEASHDGVLVNRLARPGVLKAKPKDHGDEGNVLVEREEDELGEAEVAVTAMDCQKAPEALELWKGVIAGAGGLGALLADDAHSDVGHLDHADIVGPISHTEADLFALLLDELDHKGFLKWGDTAAEYSGARLSQGEELHPLRLIKGKRQRRALNHQGSLPKGHVAAVLAVDRPSHLLQRQAFDKHTERTTKLIF